MINYKEEKLPDSFKGLLDEYIGLYNRTTKISDKLFPKIYDILKLWCDRDCQHREIGQIWIDRVEDIDPWIGEQCLNVTLDSYDDCDVVSFPLRYLSMDLESVKSDVKRFNDKVQKERENEELEREREEYMRLKAKFENEERLPGTSKESPESKKEPGDRKNALEVAKRYIEKLYDHLSDGTLNNDVVMLEALRWTVELCEIQSREIDQLKEKINGNRE